MDGDLLIHSVCAECAAKTRSLKKSPRDGLGESIIANQPREVIPNGSPAGRVVDECRGVV